MHDHQISIFEALEPGHASEQAQESAKEALALIIKRVEDDLIRRGRPCGWVSKIVDPSQKYAYFRAHGKPSYTSSCPHYQGFWLDGGCGSVQCALHSGLMPGIIWDEVCSRDGGASCPLKSCDTTPPL